MNTFVSDRKRVTYANSGGAISSGDLVILASGTTGACGVAVTDIAANTGTGEVEVDNIHVLPKNVGEVFTFWQVLYRDASTGKLTNEASGNTRAGRCTAAADSAATTATCLLNAV